MNMYVYQKHYFKESREVQRGIMSAVNNLYTKIQGYEQQNVPFEKIFNDDKIKYDKHGQFYTFKDQRSNMQLRILYAYIVIDGTPVIVVADYYIKKKNNTEYIKVFKNMGHLDKMYVYSNSRAVNA